MKSSYFKALNKINDMKLTKSILVIKEKDSNYLSKDKDPQKNLPR